MKVNIATVFPDRSDEFATGFHFSSNVSTDGDIQLFT